MNCTKKNILIIIFSIGVVLNIFSSVNISIILPLLSEKQEDFKSSRSEVLQAHLMMKTYYDSYYANQGLRHNLEHNQHKTPENINYIKGLNEVIKKDIVGAYINALFIFYNKRLSEKELKELGNLDINVIVKMWEDMNKKIAKRSGESLREEITNEIKRLETIINRKRKINQIFQIIGIVIMSILGFYQYLKPTM